MSCPDRCRVPTIDEHVEFATVLDAAHRLRRVEKIQRIILHLDGDADPSQRCLDQEALRSVRCGCIIGDEQQLQRPPLLCHDPAGAGDPSGLREELPRARDIERYGSNTRVEGPHPVRQILRRGDGLSVRQRERERNACRARLQLRLARDRRSAPDGID